jgi:hypothetical protein
MNLRVGPDGALYIVDMYREIIEDYSAVPRFLQQQYGLNKGKEYGRIWRLRPKGKALALKENLGKVTVKELAQALADDNPWRRSTAQRILIERNDRTTRDLLARLIRAEGVASSGVIRALQTLKSLKSLKSSDVVVALNHEDYGVRVHGLRLAEPWLDSDEALRSQLIKMSQDPDPRVRLQLAMTLGESKDTWSVEPLRDLAEDMEAIAGWLRPSSVLQTTGTGGACFSVFWVALSWDREPGRCSSHWQKPWEDEETGSKWRPLCGWCHRWAPTSRKLA